MGFIEDPEQFEDFPEDPGDYESTGYQHLDADGRYIMELFVNLEIGIDEDYVKDLINDLIVDGGINAFAMSLEAYGDYYLPPALIPENSMRLSPYMLADDAIAYLEQIPGWEGFAGITWVNGDWFIWVGDTV